jgi:hypothetical protein
MRVWGTQGKAAESGNGRTVQKSYCFGTCTRRIESRELSLLELLYVDLWFGCIPLSCDVLSRRLERVRDVCIH